MNKGLRFRIYEIIEKSVGDDKLSKAYDLFMMFIIVLSLVPLAFKEDTVLLKVIDKATMVIFIIDYFLRWITADHKFDKSGAWSFIRYPFSPMAIIDLISILPSVSVVNNSFKVLRVLRMIRAMRVFRFFKTLRYSRSFEIVINVFRASKESLAAVCFVAIAYIMVSALIIYNVEPDSFDTFFEAVYWATVSLTTIGYGDIYPVSTVGRVITMLSSVFGIAVVALPSGIITSGFMTELQKRRKALENGEENSDENDEDDSQHIHIKYNKYH